MLPGIWNSSAKMGQNRVDILKWRTHIIHSRGQHAFLVATLCCFKTPKTQCCFKVTLHCFKETLHCFQATLRCITKRRSVASKQCSVALKQRSVTLKQYCVFGILKQHSVATKKACCPRLCIIWVLHLSTSTLFYPIFAELFHIPVNIPF